MYFIGRASILIGKFLEVIENAQEPEPIILYGCDGEVYAIDDFLKNNLNRLTLLDHKIAEEILKAGIFKESGEHKELKSAPLTLSKDFGKEPILKAEAAAKLGLDLGAYDRNTVTFIRIEAGLIRLRRQLARIIHEERKRCSQDGMAY
jgi:hypothetical protein